MSWWVYLEDKTATPWCSYGKPEPDACPEPCYPAVEVERHTEGGTYVMGGGGEAELNITYNYGGLFREVGISMREGAGNLHGRRAGDTIATLEAAVARLGTDRHEDYWKATAGNAGRALAILLSWARQHPDAIWRVS